MIVPELLFVALLDQLEKRVAVGARLAERELRGDHREEKDANGEEVCRRASVAVIALDDLRCHVPLSSDNALLQSVAVLARDWASKAEVSDLEVEVGVEQQILGLQVAMSDALKVAVVETLEQLLDVVARDWLRKRA